MLDNQLNLAFWFLNVIQHITHILYCPIFWSRRSECSYMDINDRYWWQLALMTCLRPSSRKGKHQNYLATMSKNWWQNHSLVTDGDRPLYFKVRDNYGIEKPYLKFLGNIFFSRNPLLLKYLVCFWLVELIACCLKLFEAAWC